MFPNYWAWHRGYLPLLPDQWVLGIYPYANFPALALQSFDAPEGAGLRVPYGGFRGLPRNDYLLIVADPTLTGSNPQYFRRGQRLIGDRFEPPGGYVVGGTTYIGKICTGAGWDGAIWEASSYGWHPASVTSGAANTIAPGNGFIFQCSSIAGDGTTGPSQPAWNTTVGGTTVDHNVTWTCVGPQAAYQYYEPISTAGPVVTADATVTVAGSYLLDDDATSQLDVVVRAFRTDADDAAVYTLRGAWYRRGGAPVQLIAPTTVAFGATSSASSWSATLALNGNSVVVQVTGESGKEIAWTVTRQAG